MESNKSRGARTLFWMKASFVMTVLAGVLALFILHFASSSGYSMQQFSPENPDVDAAMNILVYILALVFVGLATAMVWGIFQFFWLLWMFRGTKNLRVVTSTSFSPWAAIICSCLPYVGLLIHYFIFKNLIKQTETVLYSGGSSSRTIDEILSKVQPVDMNFVNGFAIMALLAGSIGFIRDTSISGFLTVAFSLASMLCYMKSFTAFIKEEQALFEVYQEQQLMAKVDRVLWERQLASNSLDENGKV